MQMRIAGDQLNEDVSIASGVGSLLYLWGSRLVPDEAAMNAAGLEAQSWVGTAAGEVGQQRPQGHQHRHHRGQQRHTGEEAHDRADPDEQSRSAQKDWRDGGLCSELL